MRNPFAVGLLANGRQLADREGEVQQMVGALMEPGRRLVVYGDARMGKTSALERAAEVARTRGVPVAVATLATAGDPLEAAHRVLGAVQQALGAEGRSTIEGIARRLGVTIELTPASVPGVSPTLRFRFPAVPADAATSLLPAVLDAIDAQLTVDARFLGLCLDEFQRALAWGGEAAEWALRESLERQRALGYVLAGSQRSVIEALVTDPRRAFHKLTDVLFFGPLPADRLAAWITQQASCTRVTIPIEASKLIVRLTRGRTRDVLQLARAVWFDVYTRGAIDPYLLVQEAFERTVREQDTLYEALWQRLDGRQRAVLRAFAADPGIQIMAAEASHRFRLGPKSSVYSAVERLVDDEHLSRPAPGHYVFDDPFFRRWVQLCGLPDIGEPVPPLLPPRESLAAADRVHGPSGASAPRGWGQTGAVTPASR